MERHMPEAAAGAYHTEPSITPRAEEAQGLALFRDLSEKQKAGPASVGFVVDGLNLMTDLLVEATADLGREIDDGNTKIAALEVENGRLRDDLADLAHQVELLKAAAGPTDGKSLPEALVRRPPRKPASGGAR
jgi:hypothetical protein